MLEESPTPAIHFFGQRANEHLLKELAAAIGPGRVHLGGVVPPAEAAARLRGAVGALAGIKPGQGYDFAKSTKIYAAAGCGTPVIFAGAGDCAPLAVPPVSLLHDGSFVRTRAGGDHGREARAR